MTPLRQRFIEDLQLRNYAPKTIVAYVHQVRGLAHHFKLSPDRLDDDQIRRYLLHLLHDKHAAETSYNQAVAALRFFYEVSSPSGTVVRRLPYGKQSKRLPAVRSPQQVALFLDTVHDRTVRIVLRTIYYHGKKDHPKRVTTERPHPTGGAPHPAGVGPPPGRTRKGEVDSDSLSRVFRWIPWLISDPPGAAIGCCWTESAVGFVRILVAGVIGCPQNFRDLYPQLRIEET